MSEFLRLCVECNEFKLFASLSMSLLAASNLASRSISEDGKFSSAAHLASIFLLLSDCVAVVRVIAAATLLLTVWQRCRWKAKRWRGKYAEANYCYKCRALPRLPPTVAKVNVYLWMYGSVCACRDNHLSLANGFFTLYRIIMMISVFADYKCCC